MDFNEREGENSATNNRKRGILNEVLALPSEVRSTSTPISQLVPFIANAQEINFHGKKSLKNRGIVTDYPS